MSKVKVFSSGQNLENFGGAQKMLVDIHNGLKEYFDSTILGFCNFDKLDSNYQISDSEYLRFCNPYNIRGAVILIHARKLTTFFHFLDKVFSLNLTLIYVSHNLYTDLRQFTFLPKNIVSISDVVTQNLVQYFGANPSTITKIHNGIPDKGGSALKVDKTTDTIRILYSARVTSVKRQVEIVRNLKGKLNDNIIVTFAGSGPQYDLLLSESKDAKHFEAVGFVDDIHAFIKDFDYVLLFSSKEGLPISLMEGCMYGKPLVVNNVGGNLEIGIPGQNAFLAENFDDLVTVINSLPNSTTSLYNSMSLKSRGVYDDYFKYEVMLKKYVDLIHKSFYEK